MAEVAAVTPTERWASEALCIDARRLFDEELGRTTDLMVGSTLAMGDPAVSLDGKQRLAYTLTSAALKVREAVAHMEGDHVEQAFRFLTWAQKELS